MQHHTHTHTAGGGVGLHAGGGLACTRTPTTRTPTIARMIAPACFQHPIIYSLIILIMVN